MCGEVKMSAYRDLTLFRYWCNKVLPLVYDDSLSYYEVLCKVVDYINNIITNQQAMNDAIDTNTGDIKTLQENVAELQKIVDDIKNGRYVDLYINALKEYIDQHLEGIVGRVVKFVSFGISDDGYFTALIPSTWDFITFDTVLDYESELYGHLILNW
jgi:hypothetical protein